MGDAGFLKTRFKADPSAAFVAESNVDVVGSNVATNWGSVGFFGPLTVRPDLWDKGISQKLMEPVMQKFSQWENTHLLGATGSHPGGISDEVLKGLIRDWLGDRLHGLALR